MENENADYVHGSDLLVGILVEDVFNPLGHSKTCTITNTAETKDRAVKPTLEEKAAAAAAGKWKEKSVSGLSVSISSEGFVFTVMAWAMTNCWRCGKAGILFL